MPTTELIEKVLAEIGELKAYAVENRVKGEFRDATLRKLEGMADAAAHADRNASQKISALETLLAALHKRVERVERLPWRVVRWAGAGLVAIGGALWAIGEPIWAAVAETIVHHRMGAP